MDELLNMSAADRAAAVAAMSDAELIAAADGRSVKRVRGRKQALAVIALEVEIYEAARHAGIH